MKDEDHYYANELIYKHEMFAMVVGIVSLWYSNGFENDEPFRYQIQNRIQWNLD